MRSAAAGDRNTLVPVLWLSVPLLGVLSISVVEPLLVPKYLIAVVPAGALLLGMAFHRLGRRGLDGRRARRGGVLSGDRRRRAPPEPRLAIGDRARSSIGLDPMTPSSSLLAHDTPQSTTGSRPGSRSPLLPVFSPHEWSEFAPRQSGDGSRRGDGPGPACATGLGTHADEPQAVLRSGPVGHPPLSSTIGAWPASGTTGRRSRCGSTTDRGRRGRNRGHVPPIASTCGPTSSRRHDPGRPRLVPVQGRPRSGDLRRQGQEPAPAAVELLPEPAQHAPAHGADGGHGRVGGVDPGPQRRRSPHARVQPDQAAPPPLQRPVARRQELPVPRRHRGGRVAPPDGDAGPQAQGRPVLRALRQRLRHPRDARPAAAHLPAPDLLGQQVQQPPPARAGPACCSTSRSARVRASARSTATPTSR